MIFVVVVVPDQLFIIHIPEDEERGKGAEGVLEEIIAENFPDLGKEKRH